jgi:hypothetical protein
MDVNEPNPQIEPAEPTTPVENEIKVTIAPEEPKTNWFDTKPEEVEPIEPTEPITPAEPVTEPKEPVAPIEPTEVTPTTTPAIESDTVKSFLKEKYGIEVENLEDLKPKEVAKLSPEMEKFVEFTKETNNTSYSDFLETQKDWSQESQESVLKASMKIEKPYLNDEEIDILFSDKYGVEELDEFADESEIRANKLKEITAKDDFQKGLKLLEENKEKYKVAKGFDETIPQEFREAKTVIEKLQLQQEEDDKLIAANRSDYLAQTERIFSNDFKGFEVKVGDESMFIKPENLAETKKTQSSLDEFNNKYFDKLGKVIDPEGLHKAIYFAMNTDKVAEHFINIGKSKMAEADDLLSKNIVTSKNQPTPVGGSNIRVSVVE